MQRKAFRWFSVALVIAFALASSAQAQLRILTPPEADPRVEDLLRRGRQLESEKRWGEALSLYDEGLREHPGIEALNGPYAQARIHYDLARRYADSSFLRTLGLLNERDALALYGEVLLKIQSHYVNEPDWKALLARGEASLEAALDDPAFSRRNLPSRSADDIAAFRKELKQLIPSLAARDRQQAMDSASRVAQLANRRLQVSPTAVVFEYACGAAGSLDEYSSFLTADQLNEVYTQIEGNFVGLGIELKALDGALLIVRVIPGSPAEAAGIRAGDRILSVGGRSTADVTTDQAADLLQGAEGTLVDLLLTTGEASPRKVTVRRQHVEVPSVESASIVDRDSGTAYLHLTCFQKTTSRDLDAALWKLHGEGMKSLIIDLRGNPGGLLTAAIEVVDKFVDDGTIVSTRGRNALEDYTYTAHRAGTWHVPLVVLIDRDSASASEIFAGAIRDHHRGTIIGQRSYGKGSVQGIFPLSLAGAGMRLTTAKFYSPSGRPISRVGVEPDVVLQRTAKPVTEQVAAGPSSDDAVTAAVQVTRRQSAQR